MKKISLLFLSALLFVLSLTGCNSKYSSHYNAVMHIHSSTAESASVSFLELDGTEVFKLKCEYGKTAKIHYSGKLENGSLTVYYDCNGEKSELFSLKSGEEADSFSEKLNPGTVYIIVQTSDKCRNGACNFDLIYD